MGAHCGYNQLEQTNKHTPSVYPTLEVESRKDDTEVLIFPVTTLADGGNNQDDNRKSCCLDLLVMLLCVTILPTLLILACNICEWPSFTLHDVKLNTFNVSTTNSTLTSNIQIAISSRNEDSSRIYFDKLDFYLSYKNQQITVPTTISPTYLEKLDETVWSPFLKGNAVPLSPDLAASLAEDVAAGAVLINVKATGRLRYPKQVFTHRYVVKVNCPAYVRFGNKTVVEDPLVESCLIESRKQVLAEFLFVYFVYLIVILFMLI